MVNYLIMYLVMYVLDVLLVLNSVFCADLSHLSVVFFLSRERMLKASEVHLIQDHLLFLYVYKSTTPKLTPGLFLTKRKYWNKDVADIMHGHNWETITESTVYSQLEVISCIVCQKRFVFLID